MGPPLCIAQSMRNKYMHFLVYRSGSDSVYTHTNTCVWIRTSLRLSHRWLLWHPVGQESNGLPLQPHGEPDVLGQHCNLPRLGTHVSVNMCTCVFLSEFGLFLFVFFSRLIIEVIRWYFRIMQIELRAYLTPVCRASQGSKYEMPLTISCYL